MLSKLYIWVADRLQDGPWDSHLWFSCPCAGGACELFLTNVTEQRWWDMTSIITLQKVVMCVFLRDSLPFWPCWKGPCGKKKPWDWSPAVSLMRLSVLQYKGHKCFQQPHELEGRSCSSQASDETTALANILMASMTNPGAEDPAKLCLNSWPKEIVRWQMCILKCYYTTTGHWYILV